MLLPSRFFDRASNPWPHQTDGKRHLRRLREIVMKLRLSKRLLLSLLLGLPMGLAGLEAARASVSALPPIRIVSTPNPAVLPLLLAMSRDPGLPVQLIPVSGGEGIDKALRSGAADGQISMTWVAAKEAAQGTVPDLTLVAVTFWRGFFELAPAAGQLSQLSALRGKNLLVSGPVGGGRDAGPDILFQATMKRAGYDLTRYADDTANVDAGGTTLSVTRRVYPSGDLRVYYLPAMDAAKVLTAQTPLGNGDWDRSKPQPASGAFMAEPAATGIVLSGYLKGTHLVRAIDVQKLFGSYHAWPEGELPLGGLSLRAAVLNDPARAAAAQRVTRAYERAAADIMAARGHPLKMARIVMVISKGVTTYYHQYGLSLPALVIAAAIHGGDLVYRSDLTVPQIRPDLVAFESELLAYPAPGSFYGLSH